MTEFDNREQDALRNLGHKVSDFLKTRKGKLLPEEEDQIPAILNSLDKDLFHFRNERLLKEGGEKVISRAHDTRTDREVAIARPRKSESAREKEAFLREARITSKLQHPNILPVYEIGLDRQDVPYFVMRLLSGQDLRSVIDQRFSADSGSSPKLSMDELLGIFLKLCDAMIYAHSKSVLHLDIKPANVMIGRYGQVHLLDWGLSVVKDDGKGGLDPDLLNSVTCTGIILYLRQVFPLHGNGPSQHEVQNRSE